MSLHRETLAIDDFGPLPVVRPASITELCDCVKRTRDESSCLYPTGGRTMLGYGLRPARPGTVLDLRSLDQVIDYPARDMTITVQAGISVARLQEVLAAENQRLPLDVPLPERATLGGALAVNASGPRRYGFGTGRDYVIGISVVNDRGEEVKAGGRVVKNVAGYDLAKLYVGSLGTLGIISQVTLKVKPQPERSTLCELTCPHDRLGDTLNHLHGSGLRPVSITVLDRLSASRALPPPTPPDWVIVVGFEENAAAVEWQVTTLRECAGATGATIGRAWSDSALWSLLGDFPLAPGFPLTFKANLLPSRVAEFCARATDMPNAVLIQAEAGSGMVIGHLDESWTQEMARAAIKSLRALAVDARGNLVLLRCPPAWKVDLGVWGAPRADEFVMRAVKAQLDPHDVFNPGRFVGGL